MALATTCPACSTSFKVNPEQLKLRRGLVRCGMCDHVFSGVEYLRYVSDTQTDADLNRPDDGADRRRSHRRDTTIISTDGTTDELQTAFFLPDTQLVPNTPAGASNDQANFAPPSQAPLDKRLRKGGPRGRRGGRGRRSKITSGEPSKIFDKQTELPQPADHAIPNELTQQAHVSDQQDAVEQRPNNGQSSAKNPHSASEIDLPSRDRPVAPPEKTSSSIAQTEVPARAKPKRTSTPVITAPLTQGARAELSTKTARTDSWSAAPIWPRINEQFDEADIEEPDSVPEPLPSEPRQSNAEATRTIRSAPDGESRVIATGQAMTADDDAVDFFGQTSKPSFDFDLPPRHILLAATGLLVLLLLQLSIGNRDVLASRYPAFHSALEVISWPLGLDVQLPMHTDSLKIASFDLVAASEREPEATYVMNLLMRNKARHTLRWPAVELTLLDTAGGILVRKVFLAQDYLADSSLIERGILASSEQPVRVGLRSHTAAPVGYSVSLFYP